MDTLHCTQFEVRDYECDIQGIVNNSVYLNYLEHARHKFLSSRGIDFTALALNNINLVVIRAEVDYKRSLRSKDEFFVTTQVKKQSRLKFNFQQKIIRRHDNAIILDACITGTSIDQNGKPLIFKELDALL